MKKWMIFRSEATGDHYIFNGEIAINFMPVAHKNIWPENNYKVITDVFEASRKKMFVHDKIRYIVVSRGTFIEN